MAAALAFALVFLVGVGLALALLAAVWSEWPEERAMDRESAQAKARRDREA